MLALDLAVLTGIFVLLGLIFQDLYTKMLMRYAGVLGIIVVMFQLQVTYGFTAVLGALFLLFIAIFLFMLILDIVGLIPILIKSMQRKGWIR
jgi:hypothetical protein